ncbi:MAG: adenylyltransferase/cytidyltransferase family protein [Chloroflexota bacterium]
MITPNRNTHVGIIGRWRPVHLGHQAALHALCEQFEHVSVGIGSANIYDYRNPFTLDEVQEMVELALNGYKNYSLAPIPDTPDEDQWRSLAQDALGDPDLLVTANPYVAAMLDGIWPLAHPVEFIPEERKVPVSGSMLRRRLADGGEWQELVPPEIARYMIDHQLDQRFRAEFGLHTLALDAIIIGER